MDIDRQRIAAVRVLEALGYGYQGGQWVAPAATTTPSPLPMTAEADAMHGALVLRADALGGCTEGSDEEAELLPLRRAAGAKERVRFRTIAVGQGIGRDGL